MARFRSTAIFSPWASVLFRFAALPLGFPSLFPLGRQVSPHVSFGAPKGAGTYGISAIFAIFEWPPHMLAA